MVVVVLHPQPHQSASPERLRAYSDFLEDLETRRGDELWHATPGEIAACYRHAILAARDVEDPAPFPRSAPREKPALAGANTYFTGIRMVHDLDADGIDDLLLPGERGPVVYRGTAVNPA